MNRTNNCSPISEDPWFGFFFSPFTTSSLRLMQGLVLKVMTVVLRIKPLAVRLSTVFFPLFSGGRDSCLLQGKIKIDTRSITRALQPIQNNPEKLLSPSSMTSQPYHFSTQAASLFGGLINSGA